MFLWARTVLKLILPPSSLLILVFVGALLIRTKYRKSGKALIVAGLSILYLLSTSLVSNFMMRPLENIYAPIGKEISYVDAVVVLNSGIKDLSHIGLGQVPTSESIMRLVHGIKIHRQTKGAHLVICGSLGGGLAKTAVDLGVNQDDLLWEDVSKNTYEGALNLRAVLKGKRRIVLVTNARHMGRSVLLHKKVGFEVIPSPSDYICEKIPVHVDSIIPTAASLCISSEALYEYLSRSWYMLKGIFVPIKQ